MTRACWGLAGGAEAVGAGHPGIMLPDGAAGISLRDGGVGSLALVSLCLPFICLQVPSLWGSCPRSGLRGLKPADSVGVAPIPGFAGTSPRGGRPRYYVASTPKSLRATPHPAANVIGFDAGLRGGANGCGADQLIFPAEAGTWREDNRRVSNGEQFLMATDAAPSHPVSPSVEGLLAARCYLAVLPFPLGRAFRVVLRAA